MCVGSPTAGRIAPHIKAGYTIVGSGANTSIETGELFSTSVLFPLNDAGLVAQLTLGGSAVRVQRRET